MTTRTPRPYQTRAVADLRETMRRHRRVLLQLPTGGGKTFIATTVAKGAASKGKRVTFLVHRAELLDQTSATFADETIAHGLIRAGEPTPDRPVLVAMVQTLARRLHRVPAPDLLFVDEAHHAVAGQWRRITEAWPDAWCIGLTATPCRLDGRGLRDVFEAMVQGPTTSDLIAQGYLSPYRAFAPSIVDLSGCRTRAGDFVTSDIAAAMGQPTVVGDIVGHYRRLSAGKRAIVFASSLDHSRTLVQAFQDAGIPAAHLDGETPADERRDTLRRFATGDILALSNVSLYGEGFDLPAVETVILARPTKSLALHLQQIGRALRPAPDKTHALILNHAGNLSRHGLPDEPREWSLDGIDVRAEKTAAEGPLVRQCPECYVIHRPASACPACGYSHIPESRPVLETAGELYEVTAETLPRRQSDCQSLDDLIAFGKARGMKNPYGWARHVMRGRERRVMA